MHLPFGFPTNRPWMGTNRRQMATRCPGGSAPRDARPWRKARAYMVRLRARSLAKTLRPIVLGGRKPYLPALESPLSVKLVEMRTFPGGGVLPRYERSV